MLKFRVVLDFGGIVCKGFFVLSLYAPQLPSEVANCKVVGLFCNAELPPTMLGPGFLDKEVGIGPITTHLGSTRAQTTPCLPGVGYMPMASKAAMRKLWPADIKMTQELRSLL